MEVGGGEPEVGDVGGFLRDGEVSPGHGGDGEGGECYGDDYAEGGTAAL